MASNYVASQETTAKDPHNWRAVCRAASVEQDSERLLSLVSELLERLDDSKRFYPAPDRHLAATA